MQNDSYIHKSIAAVDLGICQGGFTYGKRANITHYETSLIMIHVATNHSHSELTLLAWFRVTHSFIYVATGTLAAMLAHSRSGLHSTITSPAAITPWTPATPGANFT